MPETGETIDPLHVLDKNEWWDVCRRLRTDLSWDEYEKMWAAFQDEKAQRHVEMRAR